MNSDLRRHIKDAMPASENGQQEFEDQTGINIETDVDHVVACLGNGADNTPHSGLVIATGRFDIVKIESLMREHGAQVEAYKGVRLLVGSARAMHGRRGGDAVPRREPTAPAAGDDSFALAFLKPGVIAVGGGPMVHQAVDLQSGGDNITTNDEVMSLVRSLDGGNNAWALGHFDALRSKARLPENVASRIPAITLFSVSAHVNGGLHGTLRAETRDDDAANNLRDVVRGFLALGKLQTGGKPEVQAMMQSLELGGTGKTVALSFAVPAEVFDMMNHRASGHLAQPRDR